MEARLQAVEFVDSLAQIRFMPSLRLKLRPGVLQQTAQANREPNTR
jgi:hypothetical protein